MELSNEMDVSINEQQHKTEESSDEEVFTRIKKRVTNAFHNSDNESVKSYRSSEKQDDSETEQTLRSKKRMNNTIDSDKESIKSDGSSEKENDTESSHNGQAQRIRIKRIFSSDDSDKSTDETSDIKKSSGTQVRLDKKKSKLKQKFHKLVASKEKFTTKKDDNEIGSFTNNALCADVNTSDSETENVLSIDKIKEKIKAKNIALKTTIYDPDTSDDEQAGRMEVLKSDMKRKTSDKSAQRASKMTAKQAMENKQKIKSEANRMLREKEVTIPYHRPKALSLKDIMNRRTPALGADGKALPIKMNDAQLKQYAKLLEERQKEMIQLCKSDTEDDEEEKSVADDKNKLEENDTIVNIPNEVTTEPLQNELENQNTSEHNDSQFDEIEQNLTSHSSNKDEVKEPNCTSKMSITNAFEVSTNVASSEVSDDVSSVVSSEHTKDNTSCTENDTSDQVIIENNLTKSSESITSEVLMKINEHNGKNVEDESQLMMLHYDSEKNNGSEKEPIPAVAQNDDKDSDEPAVVNLEKSDQVPETNIVTKKSVTESKHTFEDLKDLFDDSDNDIDMHDLDKIIKDADNSQMNTHGQTFNSPMLIKEISLSSKPKITGAPGMVIDLDGSEAVYSKKLSGVELLKERFTYFAKLKTPEQIKREYQTKIKPGTAHMKLKQELEEQMAEQRSLEWSKRMEEDKLQKEEIEALRGDGTDDDDDIEKMEAKLKDIENDNIEESESSAESECEEYDVDLTEKPRVKNTLIDDEAEESDFEENVEADDEKIDTSDEESSDSDSSHDDCDEEQPKKKGRILKAFEDSDEENEITNRKSNDEMECLEPQKELSQPSALNDSNATQDLLTTPSFNKSISEDIFASQDTPTLELNDDVRKPELLDVPIPNNVEVDKLNIISETQPYIDDEFDAVAGMCTGRFTDSIAPTPDTKQTSQDTPELGEDVLALCTGKFYDNEFVHEDNDTTEAKEEGVTLPLQKTHKDTDDVSQPSQPATSHRKDDVLDSILGELNEPEHAKPRKFFTGSSEVGNTESVQKKRFVIDSDDEESANADPNHSKKKLKKKKLKDRALQLTDDEDSLSESELDDEDAEPLVEYDSEENEVMVVPAPRGPRASAFIEQEAELTSEDEWAGSGDEDEAGPDRLEREAGDDDRFHQGRLRRELGQIHMRDVLDRDKREVRLLQELLLEDGDLGGGGRQRNFRWAAVDGEEEAPAPDAESTQSAEPTDSEEQWRRQRHEREVFLREMRDKEPVKDEAIDISFGKSASFRSPAGASPAAAPAEPRPPRDLPSPAKKPFAEVQHAYRSSLLSRGGLALARLAALASPLAAAADAAPRAAQPPAGGSFVFAAVEPDQRPKVPKRKQQENIGTPRLLKKLKTEDKASSPTSSLIEHLKLGNVDM